VVRVDPFRRAVPPPVFDGQSAVIFDVDSGHWLYLFNAHDRRTPASVTKIFTAMVAADLMGLDRVVTVPAAAVQLPPDSTLMGLSAGEQVSVRQLLYGVFLNSGNDAAETLARAVTSRDAFVGLMNTKAVKLGLNDTHFANPTGLDADNHYSTAFDLALAARYLDTHYPALAAIASTQALVIPATATHKQYFLSNLNKLLKTYPGVTGLKTGWTGIAGGCLDATATRGGHRLIAVLLGSQSLYKSTSALLDYGFERVGVLPIP
jgi:D-alanyl-D-alanine carboxypeptidase (penicillin-binding protein 5/6)